MQPDAIVAKILAARRKWVRLDAEREVCVQRPGEIELADLLLKGGPEPYARTVVDWRGPGFTAAGIFGPAQGSADETIAFAMSIWLTLAMDNAKWIEKIAESVKETAAEHFKAKESAEGN